MDEFVTLGQVKWLKNRDFILETKMVGLNKNKNSKQLDRPVVL